MVKNAKAMRERAKQLLKEASELEKKEKYEKVIHAGELVKGYFDKDFAHFDEKTFKGLVKGIFTDVSKQE